MRTARVALFTLGAVLFIALLIRGGPEAVASLFTQLSWYLLLIVVFPYGLITTLDTLGWRFAFRRNTVPFRALLSARLAGKAFNIATPTASVAGKPSRPGSSAHTYRSPRVSPPSSARRPRSPLAKLCTCCWGSWWARRSCPRSCGSSKSYNGCLAWSWSESVDPWLSGSSACWVPDEAHADDRGPGAALKTVLTRSGNWASPLSIPPGEPPLLVSTTRASASGLGVRAMLPLRNWQTINVRIWEPGRYAT